jgi:hypothetical protein
MKTRFAALTLAGTLGLGFTLVVAATTPAYGIITKAKAPHKVKPKPKPKPPAKPKVKAIPSPHIGQVAKDGKFAFTITSVQCGVTSLGSDDLTKSASPGSSWCLATMTVKAYQSHAQSFFTTNQYAIDKKGRQLSADSDGSFYIAADQNVDGESINPGISITAVVPFQVATGDTISKFILHDSAFSGGVTVYNVG